MRRQSPERMAADPVLLVRVLARTNEDADWGSTYRLLLSLSPVCLILLLTRLCQALSVMLRFLLAIASAYISSRSLGLTQGRRRIAALRRSLLLISGVGRKLACELYVGQSVYGMTL